MVANRIKGIKGLLSYLGHYNLCGRANLFALCIAPFYLGSSTPFKKKCRLGSFGNYMLLVGVRKNVLRTNNQTERRTEKNTSMKTNYPHCVCSNNVRRF